MMCCYLNVQFQGQRVKLDSNTVTERVNAPENDSRDQLRWNREFLFNPIPQQSVKAQMLKRLLSLHCFFLTVNSNFIRREEILESV